MITAIHYTVIHDRTSGIYLIKNMDLPLCPDCGQVLSGYDSRLRHVIDGSGEVRWFSLRRLRCSTCRKIHLELPDFIQSKKHYNIVITDVLNNNTDSCPADTSTIRRWKKEYYPPGLPSFDNAGIVLFTYTDMKGEE